ncbi:MAG: hypothetical protein M3N68_03815, partial [Actinomycetota bacterium]|nr:hypothetical protein [Actinomycetota bacterium]
MLARTSVASGEIVLAEIYRELEGVGPGRAPVEKLIEAELELERAQTGVVPVGAAARAAGSRIAFVSDTYLPSEFVRERLV